MKIYFLLYVLAAFLFGWASCDLNWLDHDAMLWAFPWIAIGVVVLILGRAILEESNAQDNR